jgi:hypothetical protein
LIDNEKGEKQEIVESNKKDGTRAKRSTEKKVWEGSWSLYSSYDSKISAKPAQKVKVAWRNPTKNAVTSSVLFLKSGRFHFLLLGC